MRPDQLLIKKLHETNLNETEVSESLLDQLGEIDDRLLNKNRHWDEEVEEIFGQFGVDNFEDLLKEGGESEARQLVMNWINVKESNESSDDDDENDDTCVDCNGTGNDINDKNKKRADGNCNSCGGTGVNEKKKEKKFEKGKKKYDRGEEHEDTSSNEAFVNSSFDGKALKALRVSEDKENSKKCPKCHGSGHHRNPSGVDPDDKYRTKTHNTCFHCKGKGVVYEGIK